MSDIAGAKRRRNEDFWTFSFMLCQLAARLSFAEKVAKSEAKEIIEKTVRLQAKSIDHLNHTWSEHFSAAPKQFLTCRLVRLKA